MYPPPTYPDPEPVPRPTPTPTPTPTPAPEPAPYIEHIGASGEAALWVAFVIFVLATLLIAVLAARWPASQRSLHLLALISTGIAALSYYAMATGSGVHYVYAGWHLIQGEKRIVFRQVFWARYVDWAITSPLLILALVLIAGLPWLDVLLLLLATEVAVLCTTFAAITPGHNAARWGWYAFSCLFLLIVFSSLLWKARRCAKRQVNRTTHLYTGLAIYTVVIWVLYPIIFALGNRTGTISPNGEVIAYVVLDIFAKAVWAVILVSVHRHDGDEGQIARFADIWTVERGRGGAIQLPGED